MRKLITLTAIAVLISPSAFADPNSGTIRICRDALINGIDDKQAITIPKGSEFAQDLTFNNQIGTVITTTEDVTVGPRREAPLSPACSTVHAKVVSRPGYALALTKDIPLLARFTEPRAAVRTHVVSGYR